MRYLSLLFSLSLTVWATQDVEINDVIEEVEMSNSDAELNKALADSEYICHKPLDLIIALDYSNSTTPITWKNQCSFAYKIVTDAFRGNPKVRIGILHFGTTAVIDLTLPESDGSLVYIRNKLRKLKNLYPAAGRTGEWTRTDLGLSKALRMFQNDRRKNAIKILAVLTDGYAVDPKLNSVGQVIGYNDVTQQTLLSYRSKLKKIDVQVLALGFGLDRIKNKHHKDQAILDLKAIATSKDMVFLRRHDELFQKGKIEALTRTVCPVESTTTTQAPITTKLPITTRSPTTAQPPTKASTCHIKYEALGCYGGNIKMPRPIPELIITDRDSGLSSWSGIPTNWKKWDSYMVDFICRCAAKTQEKGYVFFGMQFFGECWSGPEAGDTYSIYGKRDTCVKQGYKPCQTGDLYCIGKKKTNYVYKVIPNGGR